jgi:hypothetical protein
MSVSVSSCFLFSLYPSGLLAKAQQLHFQTKETTTERLLQTTRSTQNPTKSDTLRKVCLRGGGICTKDRHNLNFTEKHSCKMKLSAWSPDYSQIEPDSSSLSSQVIRLQVEKQMMAPAIAQVIVPTAQHQF